MRATNYAVIDFGILGILPKREPNVFPVKKTCPFLLGGLMTVITFASQAQSLPQASAEPIATASAVLSLESTTAPARQAGVALVTASTAPVTESSSVAPAEQQASQQPQMPAKPAKVSKGVWIAIGIGALLAVVRIVASN